MKHQFLILHTLLFWIGFAAGTATAAPTTKPTTAPVAAPAPRVVKQDSKTYAYHLPLGSTAPLVIHDVVVSNGGIVLAQGGSDIEIHNCTNQAGSPNGGMYAGMFWPASGKCLPKVLWDNSGTTAPVVQGSAECAVRGKINDAHFVHITFKGFLKGGKPWKQVVEARAGNNWLFENCDFKDSWPDLGEQKIFPFGYDKSQHIGTVKFVHCRWNRFNGSLPFSRQPGVDHIECVDCVGPDGKLFSKTW